MSTAATPGDLKIFFQRLKRVLGANPDTGRERKHERGCCQRDMGWKEGVCMAQKTPGGRKGSRIPTVTLSKVELAGPTKGPCTERRKVVVTPDSWVGESIFFLSLSGTSTSKSDQKSLPDG